MLNKQNKKLERRGFNLNIKSILKIHIKNMYQLKKIRKKKRRLGFVGPDVCMLQFFFLNKV